MFAGGLFRFESDERLPLLRRLRELERQMAVPAEIAQRAKSTGYKGKLP
jgi:hypothetical protein